MSSKWHYNIKSKAKEAAAGGQGEIKKSQLSPEEMARLDLEYPRPTGKAAEKPFVIKGTIE
ncbi:hypothetical protein NST07_20655 [Paenibacillus sp. FSL L8-0340]|uniref:hypothetical protein n=1 Tax=Paenibacillus sp. FSL L8-0340 TaxID=2954685 RepID=UPI0031587353